MVIVAFAFGVVLGAAIAMVLLRARRADEGELLSHFEHEMRALESERARLGGDLGAKLGNVVDTLEAVRGQTSALAEALRRPGVRGQWGEATLRNVVSAAGLSEHCDFSTQVHIAGEDGAVRPDLVVRLPGSGSLAIDAKVPLDAYLDAAAAGDPVEADRCLQRFVGHVRSNVKALAAKRYWERVGRSPEIVVMFVPSEAAVSAALLRDDRLLDDAARQGVVIATPCTLVALLQVVALAWREEAVSEHAEKIRGLGVELCRRVGVFSDRLAATSKGLEATVRSHNATIASFEGRLLVTARRMAQLGIANGEIDGPARVTRVVQQTTPTSDSAA
ncbi:MAG: recombination protein RmuC [Solirubrobacteraceae bacterium]